MVKPVVFKFGGTSLQTAERIHMAVDIMAGFEAPLVVVTSAVGGVTNQLAGILADPSLAGGQRDELHRLHLQIARELGLESADLADYEAHLAATLADLDQAGTTLDDRGRERVLSIGERLSTYLVARVLAARGLKSEYIDSRTLVRTDSVWGGARVDLDTTRTLVDKALLPLLAQGMIPIVTGFLGSNAKGETTTIGRNGSDLSATVLGSCLAADEVWIWTDVSGIYTADPRYYQGGRLLEEISFREAAEAAYFGASVIHPHTLWPLLETNVAVRIKNTFQPEEPGTLICSEPTKRGNILITTSIEGVSVITVGGYGMVGIQGVAARIFSVVQDVGTSVLMISQSSSEHNISMVVRDEEVDKTVQALHASLSEWMLSAHRIDHIRVVPDVAIVTVVGENMRGRSGIAGKFFTSLGRSEINIIAIAQGSSEYSISAVIAADETRRAIEGIHRELDEDYVRQT